MWCWMQYFLIYSLYVFRLEIHGPGVTAHNKQAMAAVYLIAAVINVPLP